MSKMRCISASVFFRSVKSGSSHAMRCRVGASRLPSLIDAISCALQKGRRSQQLHTPLAVSSALIRSERVERLLEASGVRLLRLRESLEPLGDLLEAFL